MQLGSGGAVIPLPAAGPRKSPARGPGIFDFYCPKGHWLAYYLFTFHVKLSAVWGIFAKIQPHQIISICDFFIFLKNICLWNFKACVRYFFKKIFFTKWQSFKNYERYFLFHLKSSFHSRDIQILLFPPSPIFLPVSHCLRAWSKINLKDSDIINCLSKNFITHFVWYLEKEKRYDIKTLAIGTLASIK